MPSIAFHYIDRSMNYASYTEAFSTKAHADETGMNEKDREMHAYYRLNWARSSRVEKVYTLSESAKSTLQSMQSKQQWIVITEGWCGDSAQSLPIIAKIAEESQGRINLYIVSRDSYPELLEHYRTNGSMSIPKLIACDDKGDEIWNWGPRPQSAQELFDTLRANTIEKQEIYAALHAFYVKDKGQSIETEILINCL